MRLSLQPLLLLSLFGAGSAKPTVQRLTNQFERAVEEIRAFKGNASIESRDGRLIARAANVVNYNTYNLLGCYKDPATYPNSLVSAVTTSTFSGGITVEKCLDYCAASCYTYAALGTGK